MAISENSAKVFEYLKGFVNKEGLTTDIIAEATGLNTKSVNGILLAFDRHKLFERKTVINDEGKIVKFVIPNDTITTYDPYKPSASELKKGGPGHYSETSLAILNLLKSKIDTKENFCAQDIADALKLPLASVNGSLTGFQKRGLISRAAPVGVMTDGKATNVRYINILPAMKEVE